MDLEWKLSGETSSATKNNATAEAYFDENGNKLGVTLSFYTVKDVLYIPETFAGEKVVAVNFSDISKKSCTAIYFPDSVIEFDSLNGFTSLKTVYLPASIKTITAQMMSSNTASKIETIILPCENPPVLESESVFATSTTVYIREKYKENYENDEIWSKIKIDTYTNNDDGENND